MSKTYNYQRFEFTTMNGETIYIYCHTYEHSRGWGHRGTIFTANGEMTKRITYYNRTYESFEYQSLLYRIVDEFYSKKVQANERSFITKQIKAIAERKSEECKKWVEAFTAKFNALSDETKEKLKSSNITFESVDQAEATINLATVLDTLR